MPHPTRETRRATLVRPGTLIIFSGAVGMAFLGLLPSEQQLRAMTEDANSGALSSVYLRLLIRFNEDDLALKRMLAGHLSASGKYAEARAILEPLLRLSGPDGREARFSLLRIDYHQATTLAGSDLRREELLSRVGVQLDALRDQPFESQVLTELAEIALTAQRRELALLLFERVLAPGEQNEASRRDRLDNALSALLAHGAGREALALAEASISWRGDDRKFLQRAVDIALSQGDQGRAQAWGRRVVALARDDIATLSKQLDIELASSDLPAAVQLAKELVELEPANMARRAQLAQIAQWDGQQELALEQWSALARRDPLGNAMTVALDLAQGLDAHERWVELAGHLMRTRALEPRELETLSYLHATQLSPARFVAFLKRYVALHPEHREAWERLAEAYVAQGNLGEAARTWERMTPALVPLVESAVRQAALLEQAGRREDAISCLRRVSGQATRKDIDYWRLRGDLAWAHSYRNEAVDAYRLVWDARGEDAVVVERLVEANRDRGEPMLVVATARQAYERRGEARWLLLAMDAAAQASLWSELKTLADTAQREEHRFVQSEMYWLLQAHLATHERRMADAQTAYDAALQVNSASLSARIGTLWLELETGDKDRLARHLDQWRNEAADDPLYWAPFAAGLASLGRVSESLPWFDRQARHEPDNLLWQMSYADALARSGRSIQAWRLRNHVHLVLQRQLGREAGQISPVSPQLLLTHAALVQEFEGAQAGEQVLRALLLRGSDDAAVRERAIASYLAKADFESARRWLLSSDGRHGRTPAWQQLALGVAQDDKAAIARILQEKGEELSAEDRVTAMRRVGRDEEALVLAKNTVVEREGVAAEAMQQQIDELAAQRARAGIAQRDLRRLGELEISRTQVSGSIPLNGGRAVAQLAINQLRSKGDDLSDVPDERDISVQYEHPMADGRVRLAFGSNQRRDESATYGRYEWSGPVGAGTTARLDLSINAVTDESAALRAIGTRDKLAAGVEMHLSDREFVRAELAAQRFSTRDGHTLGKGYRVDAELASALSRESPLWQVRLQGSFQKNSVEDSLPRGLARSVLPASTEVESVLARRYGSLGVGTTVRIGGAEEFSRRSFAQMNAWAGRVWPEDKAAYQMRLAWGTPVRHDGMFSVEAFYTNVQGGHASEAYRGVGLLYTHRF